MHYAYEQHKNLILAFKRGEKIDLRQLNQARQRADRVGEKSLRRAAASKA